MEDGPLRFALRETRDIMTRPTVIVSLLAVIVILAISGPFGTSRSVAPGPRVVYWAFVVISTFGTGSVISAGFNKALLDEVQQVGPAGDVIHVVAKLLGQRNSVAHRGRLVKLKLRQQHRHSLSL